MRITAKSSAADRPTQSSLRALCKSHLQKKPMEKKHDEGAGFYTDSLQAVPSRTMGDHAIGVTHEIEQASIY